MANNNKVVLVVGESATGKSASLKNIPNPEKWEYINAENKPLPFGNIKFRERRITDPEEVFELLDEFIANPDSLDGLILDTITFLMDMYETQYVLTAEDTRAAWANYGQFFRIMMQEKIPVLNKPTVILAHTRVEYDEKAKDYRAQVPIKGALKNTGVEAYFTTVVAAKKIRINDLKPYKNDMLNITEDDIDVGFKHVFQTRITKDTTGERIRSPMGLFNRSQTYIDNDVSILLNHIENYYKNQ